MQASLPEGQVEVAQVVLAPRKVPVQAGCVVAEQTVATQHAPLATGQVLGLQVPPVVQLDVPTQLAWVVNVHAPELGTQQEPVAGCAQGFGEQTPPEVQVAPPVQLANVVTEHVPAVTQQEPVVQGLGVQVEPGSPQTPAPHAVCVATEQVVPVQQLAVTVPLVAPPGVGMDMAKEVPVPGRQRPTRIVPVAGAALQVKRKLKRLPQRITLPEWSLPVPATKPPVAASR